MLEVGNRDGSICDWLWLPVEATGPAQATRTPFAINKAVDWGSTLGCCAIYGFSHAEVVLGSPQRQA